MIIDLILDRADGTPYNAHDFYTAVSGYAEVFQEIVEPITKALDCGTENDVKQELCEYVQRLNYNPKICDYINSVEWLKSDTETVYTPEKIAELLAGSEDLIAELMQKL